MPLVAGLVPGEPRRNRPCSQTQASSAPTRGAAWSRRSRACSLRPPRLHGKAASFSAQAPWVWPTPPSRAGQARPKMAASRYRRFLKLCEEWPVDETKRGRDLGTYLRQRVAQAFREGENTQVIGLWGLPSAGRRLGRGKERTRQGRD